MVILPAVCTWARAVDETFMAELACSSNWFFVPFYYCGLDIYVCVSARMHQVSSCILPRHAKWAGVASVSSQGRTMMLQYMLQACAWQWQVGLPFPSHMGMCRVVPEPWMDVAVYIGVNPG